MFADIADLVKNVRNCRDMFDIPVREGQIYIPGPSKCVLCRCIIGRARYCQTLQCNEHPPKVSTELIKSRIDIDT